ncbi:MAG: hypothetical protein DRO73_09530 [Candidatus Thorarchaeota archaeon]|nr:MAG: hypothetical protein DRO73_09530 [Candidatus Thorarchaeota archaeon]RLI52617.1 MAG: hypothetical protein DRO87_12905 [Candidatus Thorarchaeota archaeon]RLI62421.1 MAG: hypothetical protein DRO93_01325 [Candidatus Thorarchaeota archaeon]
MSQRRQPDDLDLSILSALNRLGGKASAELLSELLGRPARTIRYRLSRLKANGYLKFLYAQTHDAKLGLGDVVLFVDLAPGMSDISRVFREVPLFYVHASTYGCYNGHVVHMTYPLSIPDAPVSVMSVLHKRGLITKYHLFETRDFMSTAGDLERLDVKRGWNWDWKQWVEDCKRKIRGNVHAGINFQLDMSRAKFDQKDIDILRILKSDAGITLRELGQEIGLSQTQINKRIKRLEREGVIIDYRWIYEDYQHPVYVYCLFTCEGLNDPILSCLLGLPFPKELAAESETSYAFRVKLYPSDIAGFFQGLDVIRKHFKSYFVQIAHRVYNAPMGQLYMMFDSEKQDWNVPFDQYLSAIETMNL